MQRAGTDRSFALGLVGSAALHALAIVALIVLPEPRREPPLAADSLAWVDVELAPTLPPPEPEPEPEPAAPEPAEREPAPAEPEAPAPAEPAPAEPQPATEAPPAPPPPDPPAGATTPEAGLAPVAPGPIAPPPTAGRDALAALARSGAREARPPPAAESTQRAARGLAALAAVPPMADELAASPSPGAIADLNRVLPGEPVVSVIVRLDRLRDTIWAQRTEAIVAPMPDYRALVAADAGSFFDHFDTLIMSSPRPRDVTATLVAARIRKAPEEARAFLDRAASIAWRPGPRGLTGERAPGPGIHRRDDRQLLLAPPAWLVLSPRAYLSALDDAAAGSNADWLARLAAIERLTCAPAPCPDREAADELGADAADADRDGGPVVVATVANLPASLRLPIVGRLPAPSAGTITLTQAGLGFYLRGHLRFESAAAAAGFVAAAGQKRDALTRGITRQLLASVRALNAAEGLRLEARGDAVVFSTSFSALDGRSLLDLAARYVALYYEQLSPPPVSVP